MEYLKLAEEKQKIVWKTYNNIIELMREENFTITVNEACEINEELNQMYDEIVELILKKEYSEDFVNSHPIFTIDSMLEYLDDDNYKKYKRYLDEIF